MVFADADMDQAIPGAASAIFFNHGQVCSAGSRLYVEDSAFDEVIEGVAEQASRMKVGPGMDPATEMGPLVAEEQLDRVWGYVESGFAEGARALQRRPEDGRSAATSSSRPYWWTPTRR